MLDRIHTRVSKMLGIRYPVLQGGMPWIGGAELAAAVSNAGGLGMLCTASHRSPAELAQEIEHCRGMTNEPFGVNVTFGSASDADSAQAWIQAICEARVAAVEVSRALALELLAELRSCGIKVLVKCTSVRQAASADLRCADAVVLCGHEAAGEVGRQGVGGLLLVAAASRKMGLPLIAAGGIADGRGVAGALALGAEGVSIGTRLCATAEATLHDNFKRTLIGASERRTRVILQSTGQPMRVLRNSVADTVTVMERRPGGCDLQHIKRYCSPERTRAALESGAVDDVLLAMGQGVALIDDIPTCQGLFERLVSECAERLLISPEFWFEMGAFSVLEPEQTVPARLSDSDWRHTGACPPTEPACQYFVADTR